MERLVVLLTLVITVAAACPCNETVTAQRSACKNDFVIQAKVTGETKRDDKFTKYRLQVEAIYKRNRAFDRLIRGGRTIYVETQDDDPCRVNMTKKVLYAVTGRVVDEKTDVTACDFVVPWADIPGDDRAGLENWYYNACSD